MNHRRLGLATALSGSLLVAACGGEAAPAAGTPAEAGPAATAEQQPAGQEQQDSGQTAVLEREVFSYSGAARDPFASLLRTGDVRPLLEDLRITSINYDNQFPMNSVAVISDTTEQARYAVRVGDQLGRLRVSSIREREVVLAYEEFGRELQDTLRMRRNQEGSQ